MSKTILEYFGHREPKPFVIKGVDTARGTSPNLMMGVELEIEGCDQEMDWYLTHLPKYGWNTTIDESLRGINVRRAGNQVGGNAFEFISKPMPLHTLLVSLEEFFKTTKFSERNYSDRTSVHVHVNCLDLTFDQLSAVSLLYTVVEEILFKFIGNNRENNIYCIPWSACRMNHDVVDRLETEGNTAIKRWAKYTALNLLPLATQGTVEFRHMHGNADVAYIQKWTNILGALFRYGTQRQLTDMVEEVKALNNTSEYEVFFNQVFAGLLPYDDSYREALEAGVIVAKFSLINWKKKDKINVNGGKKFSIPTYDDSIEIYEEAPAPAQVAPRPRPAVRAHRLNPWPANGTVIDLQGRGAASLSVGELTTLNQNGPNTYRMNDRFLTILQQPATVALNRAFADLRANPYDAEFNSMFAQATNPADTTGNR